MLCFSAYCHINYLVFCHCSEISRMNPADLAKDTSGTRSYASFLMELAEKVPAVMLPNLSLLQGLLDGEVCFLNMLHFIVIYLFTYGLVYCLIHYSPLSIFAKFCISFYFLYVLPLSRLNGWLSKNF